MQDIQKQTYSKLISSKIYSDDTFCAKSITLDFMYQFNNPCIAMLSLTDVLIHDNCIAKIGLKCTYGIVLAVDDYFKYTPKVIMSKFTKTLIDGVVYKIADISIDDHDDCMINIMQFIAQNVDFNLLYPYFELIRPFRFSDLQIEKNKRVYDAYCQNLRQVCDRLLKENEKLFFYKLNGIRSLYESFRNDTRLQDFTKVIDEFFNKVVDRVYVLTNNSSKSAWLQNHLQKEFGERICNLENDEIDNIINEKCKVIFILDFEQENKSEMLYYLGKLEGILRKKEMFIAIFYGCFTEFVETNPAIKKLIDRYIQGENLENKYGKIVEFIKK